MRNRYGRINEGPLYVELSYRHIAEDSYDNEIPFYCICTHACMYGYGYIGYIQYMLK